MGFITAVVLLSLFGCRSQHSSSPLIEPSEYYSTADVRHRRSLERAVLPHAKQLPSVVGTSTSHLGRAVSVTCRGPVSTVDSSPYEGQFARDARYFECNVYFARAPRFPEFVVIAVSGDGHHWEEVEPF